MQNTILMYIECHDDDIITNLPYTEACDTIRIPLIIFCVRLCLDHGYLVILVSDEFKLR